MPFPSAPPTACNGRRSGRTNETGETPAEIKLLDEVNGAYEVLVKVELLGKAAAADAQLKDIAFQTLTMLNSKTQPSLRLGKNTVYVGAGEQSDRSSSGRTSRARTISPT